MCLRAKIGFWWFACIWSLMWSSISRKNVYNKMAVPKFVRVINYENAWSYSPHIHMYPRMHVTLTWHADCTSLILFISLFTQSLWSNPAQVGGTPSGDLKYVAPTSGGVDKSDLPAKRKIRGGRCHGGEESQGQMWQFWSWATFAVSGTYKQHVMSALFAYVDPYGPMVTKKIMDP